MSLIVGTDSTDKAASTVLFNYSANNPNYNVQTAVDFITDTVKISNGNVGIGVTPSAWGTGWKAIQVGTLGIMSTTTGNSAYLMSNAYWDGTSYRFVITNAASKYDIVAGQHRWQISPSGTAGTPITWTQAMTLDSSGNLGLGTASPSNRLHVTGGTAIMTRGNTSGASTTVTSSNWIEFASWIVSNTAQSARARIVIMGGIGYGQNQSAETIINLVVDNTDGLSGHYYSTHYGAQTQATIVWKYDVDRFRLYMSPGNFASTAAVCDASYGYFANVYTDTGSATQPAGTTALPSQFSVGTSGAERLKVTSGGAWMVGTSSVQLTNSHEVRGTSSTVGQPILSIAGANGPRVVACFYHTDVAGYNTASTALTIEKMSGTSRSINAAGTINASGADYAEYEHNNGIKFVKGALVGFKADGTLTDRYSESIRFGIKSTNPSYVGGDTWGSEEAVGPKPVEPVESDFKYVDDFDKAKAKYEAEFVTWSFALEAARQSVDRIAYSGKVPVNVLGATPGDYIVAIAGETDSIIGEYVSDVSFDQYKKAVGRVNRILEDGRAEVAVIVH